jgi:hypothetical protein
VDDNSNIDKNPIYIDCSYYYRMMNTYSGPLLALDVDSNGSTYAVKMASISDDAGQYWRCIHLGNNDYNLRTRFLKDQYSLDIVNDGTNTKPHMAKSGGYTGQRWHFTRQDDGTFKLSNDFTGNSKFLDVYSNIQFGQMSNSNVDYTGQHWTFKKIGKVADY